MRRKAQRTPSQSRARATVEDILVATARVLEREGHDAATTARIAAVAGVSPGTLYQYFAGRDAVIEALQERHFERMGDSFLQRMEQLVGAPLPEFTEGLAELMRQSPLLNSKLSRVLLAHPRRGKPESVLHLERRCAELLIRHLQLLEPRLQREKLELPIFVLVRTVQALILTTSQERPSGVTRERFTRELASLTLRYLAPVLEIG